MSGELSSCGGRLFDFVAPPNDEASAFDVWFHDSDTKEASAQYVHDFIMRHRDRLYRTV